MPRDEYEYYDFPDADISKVFRPEEGEELVLTFTLADGQDQDFLLRATFCVDDQLYMALSPFGEGVDQDEVILQPYYLDEEGEPVLDGEGKSEEEMEIAWETFDYIIHYEPEEGEVVDLSDPELADAPGEAAALFQEIAADPESDRLLGELEEQTDAMRRDMLEEQERARQVQEAGQRRQEAAANADLFGGRSNAPDMGSRQEMGVSPEDYCYEDAQGRLFLYGSKGEIVYLDENGDPVQDPDGGSRTK